MTRTARPPIIVVMGHIDHGKSSLLDYIRKTNIVAKESGGITQHVSAYEAEHMYEGSKRRITFLDTPGHEAFHALRARGASVADVAILVVAADEGVKPQTLDALAAITKAEIPYVVALTKMDKREADIEKAKASLIKNEVYLEGLGGQIPYTAISSKSGEGINELLDLVLLTADIAEPTAATDTPASGFVLESTKDPKRGLSATLIIKDGTLKLGTCVVVDDAYAPVRFIENFLGERVTSAGPSTPVRIIGFSALPPVGASFQTVSSRKEAEVSLKKRIEKTAEPLPVKKEKSDTILPLIIKADVTGSLEAIHHELTKIVHERAAIYIIDENIGAVSESDIKMAHAANGVVIAFNTPVSPAARDSADRVKVPVESFTVIYDLEQRVAELLAAHAPRITEEVTRGEAKVLKIFSTTSHKHVAGARLISGVLTVGVQVKILRRDIEIGRGKITNLQQARADVKEIHTEGEFGFELESRISIAGGDVLVAYELVKT